MASFPFTVLSRCGTSVGIMTKEGRVGTIASKGQLRMSFLRWAIVIVPLTLLLGFASGRSVPSGSENGWYQALAKPELTPPGWVFPVAWTTLYILIGLALAMGVASRSRCSSRNSP